MESLTRSRPPTISESHQVMLRATVAVGYFPPVSPPRFVSLGTGFVVHFDSPTLGVDWCVITCSHVVERAGEIFIQQRLANGAHLFRRMDSCFTAPAVDCAVLIPGTGGFDDNGRPEHSLEPVNDYFTLSRTDDIGDVAEAFAFFPLPSSTDAVIPPFQVYQDSCFFSGVDEGHFLAKPALLEGSSGGPLVCNEKVYAMICSVNRDTDTTYALPAVTILDLVGSLQQQFLPSTDSVPVSRTKGWPASVSVLSLLLQSNWWFPSSSQKTGNEQVVSLTSVFAG